MHNISIWGKGAEIVEKYLKKGSKVYIEGKITYRKYQDKDGVDRYSTDIKADTFKFLDSKESNPSGGNEYNSNSTQSNQPSQAAPNYTDADDLPF